MAKYEVTMSSKVSKYLERIKQYNWMYRLPPQEKTVHYQLIQKWISKVNNSIYYLSNNNIENYELEVSDGIGTISFKRIYIGQRLCYLIDEVSFNFPWKEGETIQVLEPTHNFSSLSPTQEEQIKRLGQSKNGFQRVLFKGGWRGYGFININEPQIKPLGNCTFEDAKFEGNRMLVKREGEWMELLPNGQLYKQKTLFDESRRYYKWNKPFDLNESLSLMYRICK